MNTRGVTVQWKEIRDEGRRHMETELRRQQQAGAAAAACAGKGLGALDRRLDAYYSVPVVSALLFSSALGIVLMLDHELLEGCNRETGECLAPSMFTKHMATAPMHLVVALNLFIWILPTAVFYFGKEHPL